MVNEIIKNNKFNVSKLDSNYITTQSENLFNEISSNKNPTFAETLLQDIKIGLTIELGVAAIIGGRYNNIPFDVNDFDSYGWDILGPNNEKIEVKRKNRTHKYLNFNFKTEEYDGKYSFYDTFYKNCDKLDFLIVADIVDNCVTIEYLINAKTFRMYVQQSNNIRGGSSHYYRDNSAETNGDLVRF